MDCMPFLPELNYKVTDHDIKTKITNLKRNPEVIPSQYADIKEIIN